MNKQFLFEKYLNKDQLKIIDEIILLTKTGSHLYGTNTPNSDLDYQGIFIPTINYILGLDKTQVIKTGVIDKDNSGKNTKNAIDISLYEIKQFFILASQNNPNIIEILFTNDDNIVKISDIGKMLIENRKIFLHKGLFYKFSGYAYSQKRKMIIKKENYINLIEAYEDLKKIDDKETMEEILRNYNFKWIKKNNNKLVQIGDLKFGKERLVKKVRQIIKERIDKATHRSNLILEYGYDTKFASHLIRLLMECRDLLKYGEIKFPLPYAYFLLEIKQGKYEVDYILQEAEKLENECKRLYDESDVLPYKMQHDKINKLLIKIYLKKLNEMRENYETNN